MSRFRRRCLVALGVTAAVGISVVGSVSAGITADVQVTPSGPVMRIDGKPVAPTMYWLTHEHEHTKTAAKHGVNIITPILWGMPWWRDGKVSPAKVYVFLDVFRLDKSQVEAIRRHACRKGCTVVWMYAPGIVTEGTLQPKHLEEVTGIILEETDRGGEALILETTGEVFLAGHSRLSPTFAVEDEAVEVIARYQDGGEVAVAAKQVGGYTSVYCGTLQLPINVLRQIVEKAGVHVYSEQGDIIMAGKGFVAIHASLAGAKTLRMPGACELKDALSRETLGRGTEFRFDMKLGETRLYSISGGHER